VKTGFAEEIKQGKVEFHYIDFQDKKNEALTKGYKVGGPTLMVARVAGGKVAEYKNWRIFGRKSATRRHSSVRSSRRQGLPEIGVSWLPTCSTPWRPSI